MAQATPSPSIAREIVAAGTPEDVAKQKRSYTGQFLKPVLAKARRSRESATEAAERADKILVGGITPRRHPPAAAGTPTAPC
jgi:hypothetical protein